MFFRGERVVRDSMQQIRSPYGGRVVGEVAVTREEELDEIMKVAREGGRKMAAMPRGERAAILDKAATLLEKDQDLAAILSGEVGKTIREARTEVLRGAGTLRLSADACRAFHGQTVPLDLAGATDKVGFFQRVPIGVVLAITPFNFPMNLCCHKIGPAIAAGNSVVIKPAGQTPLTTMRLAEVLVAAGLPPEAVTVVCGSGAVLGDKLAMRPEVRKISFTGSPEVGRHITQVAGLKKLTMELGSNAAVLVMPDADLDVAAAKVKGGAFSGAGQVCISVQRVYVHEKVYEPFLEKLKSLAETIRYGDPALEETDMGPMISQSATERAMGWIQEAVGQGARVVLGGGAEGNLMQPTILAGAPETSKIVTEEAFAPVVVVNPVSGFEDGIERINASKYGLQAGIFTNDMRLAMRFVAQVDCGGVLVGEVPTFRQDQMPYGGSKLSGLGREGPRFAIEDMTEIKMVIIDPS